MTTWRGTITTGFQPKALSSASELRSNWLEKTCVFWIPSHWVSTSFSNLSWLAICCPFPPNPPPFKGQWYSFSLAYIYLCSSSLPSPLPHKCARVRVALGSQGGSAPPLSSHWALADQTFWVTLSRFSGFFSIRFPSTFPHTFPHTPQACPTRDKTHRKIINSDVLNSPYRLNIIPK